MFQDREEYSPPVGPAREPAEERRRRRGRLFTMVFVGFIAWLAWTRVIHPPSDSFRRFR